MVRLVILGFVLFILCFFTLYETRRRVAMSNATWDDLLSRLTLTRYGDISTIALGYLNPGLTELRTDPDARFGMIGGWRGLRAIHANAGVLVALAGRIEFETPDEHLALVRELREQGTILRDAVYQIALERVVRFRKPGAEGVQMAAAAYHRMTRRLQDTMRSYSPVRTDSLSFALWHGSAN